MIKELFKTLFVNAVVFSVLFALMQPVRAWLGKRISPVLQLVLWAVVVIKLMIPFGFESRLSVFSSAEPQGVTAALQAPSTSYQTEPEQSSSHPHQSNPTTAVTAKTSQTSMQTTKTTRPIDWTAVAFGVWGCGVLSVCAFYGLGAFCIHRRLKRADWDVPKCIRSVFTDCKQRLGIKRRVRLCVSQTLGVPLMTGLFRPVLVLPADAVSLNKNMLAHIMLHELSHLKRGDIVFINLLNALSAVYWFNPFVWIAFRQIRLDIETACDHNVLQTLGQKNRFAYIKTVLMFAGKPNEKHLAAAMGMSDGKQLMSRRIQGMFKTYRTGGKARAAAVMTAVLMLTVSFLTACQPTPDKPVVVGRNEQKIKAAMVQNDAESGVQPYQAPERLDLDIKGLPDNFQIVFDAQVDVSDQTEWPIYTVEITDVTQQQADTVRDVLLGDKVLCKPGQYRSREEIQKSIQYYEEKLKNSGKEGFANLVEAYKHTLKDLYEEYERTPEHLKLEPANTKFSLMEERVQADRFGGKEVNIGDACFGYEWTDEAREKAKAMGYENIYGVCWLDNGRKMQFSVDNGDGYGISFDVAEGNLAQAEGVSLSIDEAIEKGNALIAQMGFDFALVGAYTDTYYSVNEADECESGDRWHRLIYKRRIKGVPLDNVTSQIDQNADSNKKIGSFDATGYIYCGEVPECERIIILIDDLGINSFSWYRPMNIVSKESDHVTLMPFDEVKSRIEQQLKVQTIWDETEEGVDRRRLEISKLILSYLLVEKKDNRDSYYLLPVWNVCGNMYYHYEEGKGKGWQLDENNERCVSSPQPCEDASIMTINAVDGSVISRQNGR